MERIAVTDNLLKKNWKAIYLTPIICGICAIVLGCIFNPALVAKYISSDGQLESGTVRNIYILDSGAVLIGLASIFVSKYLKVHDERKQRIVTNFLMLCGSILFTLVLVEGALKAANFISPFNRQRHAFIQYDEVLGWAHTPNKVASFRNARVQINSTGLRDDDIPYQKPDGEFRILFLGDSQLFGEGVQAEDTFAKMLEADFQNVQTINAAVIGYGTDQQALFLEKEGVQYAPDLIIVTLNTYDFQDNISKIIRSGYSKPLFQLQGNQLRLTNVPVPDFDIIERMNRRLSNMSHLYRSMRTLLRNLSQTEGGGTGHGYDPDAILLHASRLEYSITVTKQILKKIAEIGRDVNAKTVVLFLPYEMDFGSDSSYKQRISQICHELKTYSEAGNFLFIDMRDEFTTKYQSGVYLDTMHFSTEGHQIAMEILAKNLIGLNLIPEAYRR